jgi:hypothetical protein
VAISQISQKSFFIFGARLIKDDSDEECWLPTELWSKDNTNFDSPVYYIQWYPCYELEVDFDDVSIVDRIAELTDAIDKECPVGRAFGISDHGEGIVWKPKDNPNSRYWFKSKGASHSKSVSKPVISLDIEQFNNINEFLDRVLDNGRLEQGITKLKEQHKEVSQKSTGEYLKWLTGDVVKEYSIEMKDSGLDEKEVLKQVQIRGRKWFFDTLNK